MTAWRWARVAFLLGFSLQMSCGGRPCNPSSCTGCCDAEGECLAGSGLLECGAGGAICARCQPTEVCSAGACGLFTDANYDASFPPDPDSGQLNPGFDANGFLFDAGSDSGVDAGRVDAGVRDAGIDAGRPDAGYDGGVGSGTDAGDFDAGDGG